MIGSFKDKLSEQIWLGRRSSKLPSDVQHRALAKLALLDAAETLDDKKSPPGNRAGQHSVAINRQWRICFVWKDGHAHDVEIVDYH